MEVVCKIDGHQHTSRGGVNTHVVCGVVEELGAGVSLHVVGVVVAPSQLDVEPVLLCGATIHGVSAREEGGGEENIIYG